MTINFSLYDIGLNHQELILTPYKENWAKAFSLESTRLLATLNAYLPQLKFHHIGSTSIPGLAAKPVIDIMGEIDNISAIDQFEQIFKDLGYEYKGEYGIPGRRYLTFSSEDKKTVYVHLHIFESASVEVKKHLLFRDILRKNEKLCSEYQDLKLSLVEKGLSRAEYTEAKSDLIYRILTLNTLDR
jgi:GrpB-like predicted nucleotidyltransferase (UPF0157 family)